MPTCLSHALQVANPNDILLFMKSAAKRRTVSEGTFTSYSKACSARLKLLDKNFGKASLRLAPIVAVVFGAGCHQGVVSCCVAASGTVYTLVHLVLVLFDSVGCLGDRCTSGFGSMLHDWAGHLRQAGLEAGANPEESNQHSIEAILQESDLVRRPKPSVLPSLFFTHSFSLTLMDPHSPFQAPCMSLLVFVFGYQTSFHTDGVGQFCVLAVALAVARKRTSSRCRGCR